MLIQFYELSGFVFIIFILLEVLIRRYSVQTNTILFLYKRSVLTLVFAFAWLMASGTYREYPHASHLIKVFECAILMALGLIGFIEANKYLSLANVLTIQMLGISIRLLFIENQQFNMFVFLSLILSAIGILIHFSLPENRIGVFWAVLSTLGWTFGYQSLFIPLKAIGAPWSLVFVETIIFILSVLILFFRKQAFHITNTIADIEASTVIIALLSTISVLVLAYGAKFFPMDSLTPVYLCIYPISIIVVRVIFNEIILTKEWIGNGLIVTGVFCAYIFRNF